MQLKSFKIAVAGKFINVYSEMPEGWLKSCTITVIQGIRFAWIHEKKSLFTEEGREQALLCL